MKIRTKFILFIVLPILLIYIGVAVFNTMSNYKKVRELSEAKFLADTQALAAQIGRTGHKVVEPVVIFGQIHIGGARIDHTGLGFLRNYHFAAPIGRRGCCRDQRTEGLLFLGGILVVFRFFFGSGSIGSGRGGRGSLCACGLGATEAVQRRRRGRLSRIGGRACGLSSGILCRAVAVSEQRPALSGAGLSPRTRSGAARRRMIPVGKALLRPRRYRTGAHTGRRSVLHGLQNKNFCSGAARLQFPFQ